MRPFVVQDFNSFTGRLLCRPGYEQMLDRGAVLSTNMGELCQTRIGIGVTLAYKSLSYRSDSRVRGDCDRRPVPVCEGLIIVSISEV